MAGIENPPAWYASGPGGWIIVYARTMALARRSAAEEFGPRGYDLRPATNAEVKYYLTQRSEIETVEE